MKENKLKQNTKKTIQGIVIFFIFTYIFMLIWNRIMTKFFGLIDITYWEAMMFHVMINLINRKKL